MNRRRRKSSRWPPWPDKFTRRSTPKHINDNLTIPPAVPDEKSPRTPTIESDNGPTTHSANLSNATSQETQTASMPTQPAPHSPTNETVPAQPDLTTSAPTTATKPTESTAGLTEMLTAAPTIGTVRGHPLPCLAAGVRHRAPMVVLDGLAVGPYYLAGGSQSGTSHAVNGSPRQDAYDFVLTETGHLIVAIADGLGSRPTSQVGARLFCEQVAIIGATEPNSSASNYLITAAARVNAVAEPAYGLSGDNIAFVAAVAVFGSECCEVARVGDVSAFSCHPNGIFDELFTAGHGAINVVTASLPSDTELIPENTTTSLNVPIALVTDGLANDIRTSANLRAWLSKQWHKPLGAYAMGESLRYRRQGSHDDRTAVVVWPQIPIQ